MSFFRNRIPANESEQKLYDLMASYQLNNVGPYFHPTMQDIFTALSASFTLLYLFSGVITLYLLQKNLPSTIWKGLTSINLIVFGVAFLINLLFTFLPPIVLTGVVFIGFCLAYATNHIHRIVLPKN
ncbi:MAG: hypothetical protein JNL40_14250 [Cyclobacteriaceae bacterium]|nr:hypothetical protein [Cyclobacteriaceae bacterium]